jgi:poly-gamma-glutamate synthesis protein (capsule biosynthesis protein)
MKNTRLVAWVVCAAALAAGIPPASVVMAGRQQPSPVQRDFTKELANKMRGTYVVAATGGFLMQDAVGRQASPAIQRLLREAHTTIGHVELYQLDRPATGPASPAPRDVAQDLSDLGFDLLGLGDVQGGDASLRTALEALTGFKIPVAQSDRQPTFHSLPAGRAAFIAGANPVRLSTAKFVTAEQLAQLKAIRDAIVSRRTEPDVARPVGVPEDLPDQVMIFSDTFVLGPVAGEIREEVNAAERQANLMAVRATKEYADFVAFSMPMPPTPKASHYATARRPHDAVVALAHDLVENGMDMYVGHGNHVTQGIEIYKGRPIFYNLGDLSVHRADVTAGSLTAVVATATYQDGILQEVRLHPVDLGVNALERPASQLGIPMMPSADVAARVLAELQKNSEPFGTRITIENGVGIIRVPRDATVAVGQGIRDFGTFPRGGGAGAGRGGRGAGRGGF